MLKPLTPRSKSAFFAVSCYIIFSLTGLNHVFAQAGITVSPSRLYFQPGAKSEQKLTLTNPNTERDLEVGISLNDWNYDSLGNNITFDAGTLSTSCAKNVQILPGSYFTLPAGTSKEISVVMTPEADKKGVPVRTAMLYITQLNPGDAKAENGAAIKVTVRMGIKLYQTGNANAKPDIEITNFMPLKKDNITSALKLYLQNTGNIWLEGKINYELLNKQTGKKIKLGTEEFYSLPGDNRVFSVKVPEQIEKGDYTATAIVNFGKDEGLKLAELDVAI